MRSPELIARLCDGLPVAVWVAAAPSGEFVYANRLFTEIMGMAPREDVAAGDYTGPYGIHNRSGSLYPEDDLPFARALAAQDTVVVDDIVIHRHDGHRVYVRATASPMRADDGEIEFISVAFIDITAEVLAHERHDRLAEEHRFCLENMGDVVYRHDADGVFFYLSPVVEQLTGYTPDEWKQHYTTYLTDSPINEQVVEYTERALTTGETQPPYLVELRHRAGHAITWEVNETPVVEGSGAEPVVTGVIGVGRDVTRRIAHDREISRLDGDLRDRTAELERLVYTASHDLRAPLVGIEGFASEIAETVARLDLPGEDGEDLGFLSERVLRTARRLDAMLGGLTQLSRIGRTELTLGAVDVEAVLREVAEGLEWQLQRTGGRLLAENLPPCHGDAAYVGQIFRNLVENGLKHAAPDRPPEVRVTGVIDGETVVYTVADNGRGLRENEVERVFDPFYRSDPGATQGDGLGLSIVRWAAHRVGGRVWAEAPAESGAVFRVTLPR